MLRSLYPPIEPYRCGWLAVTPPHEIYYEECGNPRGMAALFLHGGPGTGADERSRRFFDPLNYRIVVFDQRGSGRSRPHASLVENTTWTLVSDLEALREHLGISRWLIFGGSWGSTLALAYAESHPNRTTALVLRGVFLGRAAEIEWFNQYGASEIFPEAWAVYQEPIPVSERSDYVGAYYRKLSGNDPEATRTAARSWAYWEAATSYLVPNEDHIRRWSEDRLALAVARIECHFVYNRLFLESDVQLLDGVSRLRDVPCVIVHGRYDLVCPARSARDLHAAWPGSELCIVPDAGHAAFEPGTVNALVSATDRFAAAGLL